MRAELTASAAKQASVGAIQGIIGGLASNARERCAGRVGAAQSARWALGTSTEHDRSYAVLPRSQRSGYAITRQRDEALDAVRLAAAYDDAFARAVAKVNAARRSGDAETLLELVKSNAPEWTTTATLHCKVAESLIALKRPGDALPLLDALIARFPRSIRPQQLKGLALARQGDWRAAQRLLGELYELGEHDPETLGILARTWRDRYAESKDLLHLRKARNLYAEAFEATPSDYYTGINAVANSVLLGDFGPAETLAAAVEKLVGTTAKRGDYWRTATAAEVQLIRRRYAEAAALYAAAVQDDPEAKSHHDSTRAQARRLMDKLSPSEVERAAIEAAFG